MALPDNMSTHLNHRYDHEGRVDSALSLSLPSGLQISRSETFDSTDSNMLSSMSSRSGPWSLYDPYDPPLETKLPCAAEEPHDFIRSCHPADAITAMHRPSSPSSLGLTSRSSPDIIGCGKCGIQFTGRYRRGSLARHVRNKHGVAKLYLCEASGCGKIFHRSDARLKHARMQHPELYLPAMQKRPEIANVGSHFDEPQYFPPGTKGKDTVDQSFKSLQNDVDSSTETKAMLHTAFVVLLTLRNQLGSYYQDYIKAYFARWAIVLERLNTEQSEAYSMYYLKLKDLQAVASAIATDTGDAQVYGHGFSSHTRQRSGTNRKALLTLSDGQVSRQFPSNISKGRSPTSHGKANSKAASTTLDVKEATKPLCIGCPFHQRWLLSGGVHSGVAAPCHQCFVVRMSEVRTHLKPGRVHRDHPGFTYYKHCGDCREDFVTDPSYQAHFVCTRRPMKQGEVIAQWIPLCFVLFSDMTIDTVPSPYIGDTTALPPDLVVQYIRQPTPLTHPLQPFLDQRLPAVTNEHAPMLPLQHLPNIPAINFSTTATNLLMQDLVAPRLSEPGAPPAQLPTGLESDLTDQRIQYTRSDDPLQWQDILEGSQIFLERIIAYRGRPTRSEVQHLVDQVHTISRLTVEFQYSHLAQPMNQHELSDSVQTPTRYAQDPTVDIDSIMSSVSDAQYYSAYIQASPNPTSNGSPYDHSLESGGQPLPPYIHDPMYSPTMSTQTSFQEYDLAPTNDSASTVTGHTSQLETIDPALLNPLPMQRAASSRSEGVHQLRRSPRSTRSLHEAFSSNQIDNCPEIAPMLVPASDQPSFIDASLSEHDDSVALYFYQNT